MARTRRTDVTASKARRPAGRSADILSNADGDGRKPAARRGLVSDQVRRLALFTAIGAGLWSFGLSLELVLLPLTLDNAATSTIGVGIEIVGVCFAGDVWYMRFSPHSPEVKRTVGLVYSS